MPGKGLCETSKARHAVFRVVYAVIVLRIFYAVKSSTAKPLCRMIDRSVPVLSSLWFGTGTVTVVPGRVFCIMI